MARVGGPRKDTEGHGRGVFLGGVGRGMARGGFTTKARRARSLGLGVGRGLVVGGWWLLVVGCWLLVVGCWLLADWLVFKIVLVLVLVLVPVLVLMLVLVLVLDPRPIACFAGGSVCGLITKGRRLVAGGREAIEALNRHPRLTTATRYPRSQPSWLS